MQKQKKAMRRKLREFLEGLFPASDSTRKRIKSEYFYRDYQEILRKARKMGLKPAAYQRELVLADLRQKPLISEKLSAALMAFTVEIRRIGNNINQVAAQANAAQRLGILDLLKVKKEYHRLEERVKDFILNPQQYHDNLVHEPEDSEFRTINDLYE